MVIDWKTLGSWILISSPKDNYAYVESQIF